MSKQTESYIKEMNDMYNKIKKKQSEKNSLTREEDMFLKLYDKTIRGFCNE